MNALSVFFVNIWDTINALAPWFFVGLIVAGLLHLFVPNDFISRHLGNQGSILTVFKAVFLGVPLPLCSCGVIPAALGIKKQGANDGAAIGFLISTPQTGVDSIMVSASMLGLPFALFKLFSAFITGIVAGLLTYFIDSKQPAQPKDKTQNEKTIQPKRTIAELFSFAIDDIFKMIWKWMLAGIFVSALITAFLPKTFFQDFFANSPILTMFIVLVISLPMYVCATASVPMAAALVYAGMPTGAALVFLMAGPASNVATIGAVYRAFGLKKLFIYLFSIIFGSISLGLLFDSVIPTSLTKQTVMHGNNTILSSIASILFIYFILRFMFKEILIYTKSKKESTMSETKTISVKGITCEGCASKIKGILTKLAEVSDVQVDVSSAEVTVKGVNLSLTQLENAITNAGFTVI